MRGYHQLAHLLAANFETILYLWAAWWASDYLKANYPRDFNWSVVTYAFALLLILRSWYLLLRSLKKRENNDRVDKKSGE